MPHIFVFDLARVDDHDGHTDGRFALDPPDQADDDLDTNDDTQGAFPWR